MEKNNFEKQVREKLSELNIQPSEKTWTGIEKRINKKNSRRKILWLFFVGIIIIAGIVLLQMNQGSKGKTFSHLPETNIKARSEAGSKSDDSLSMPGKNIGEKHPNSFFQSSAGSKGQKIIAAQSAEEIKPRFEKEITKSKSQEVQDHTVSPDTTVQSTEPASQSQNTKFSGDLAIKDRPGTEQMLLNSKENKTGPEVAKFDSTVEMKSTEVETALIHSLIDKKIDKEKSNERDQQEAKDLSKVSVDLQIMKPFSPSGKKWEIGFSMAAGKFFLGDGINLGLGLEKNNVSGDLSYNNPGLSLGNGNFQSIIGPPSTIENSIEFKAGLNLRKHVSRKSFFSTGLGYAYYTNTILIGDLLPSNNYSSVGMLTSYRNNIHFIELPLSMSYKIIDQAKIPLNLSVGVIVSQLVSSDAMQYKSGFYSVNNSLFHNPHIGFSAGFSADFSNRLSVGPYYKYGINPLSKEGLYGKKHLNSFGLKVDYIFRKNK